MRREEIVHVNNTMYTYRGNLERGYLEAGKMQKPLAIESLERRVEVERGCKVQR